MVKFRSKDKIAKIQFELAIYEMFEDVFLIETQDDYEDVVDYILETVSNESVNFANENDDVYLEPYNPI